MRRVRGDGLVRRAGLVRCAMERRARPLQLGDERRDEALRVGLGAGDDAATCADERGAPLGVGVGEPAS